MKYEMLPFIVQQSKIQLIYILSMQQSAMRGMF